MSDTQNVEPNAIEWGVASAAFEGDSGDLHVVAQVPNGALVAVMDGLGHGLEAAAAAQMAAEIIQAHLDESVLDLVRRCHEGLRNSRGVVMSLASFDTSDSSITWIGVGNVEGILLRANATAKPPREAVPMRGGVVGYNLPPLRAAMIPVSPGDTLIMATDGIRSGFVEGVGMHRRPQDNAELLLAKYAKRSDDALVLVARYLGQDPHIVDGGR
jgi:phosphoserine phosphatase RsbX